MAEYYVATNGSDSNAGTKDSPFKTIQEAASVAGSGSTVHVAPGNYSGGINTSASGVKYVSDVLHGAKINSGSADMAWNNKGDGVTISGFEVDGTNASYRIGIYTTGSNSVVENSKVHDIARDGQGSGGGGGAGVYGDGYNGGTNITLRGNEIFDIGPAGQNSSLVHGIYHTTTGTISNNLVYNNAGVGLHLWHDPHDLNITNNTVFNNNMGAWVGAGDHYNYSGAADNIKVANNIFYDNRSYGITEGGDTGTHNTYTNNLVYGNGTNINLQNGLSATGTVSADPKFVKYMDAGGGDYHLAAGSPAINAGTSTNAPTTDIDGSARVGAVDIGALEYGGTSGGTTTPTAPTPSSAKIVVNAQGTAADGVNPHFDVLIDGKKIGEGTATTTSKDYTFSADVASDAAHKVQVQYDNDDVINGVDRNLFVNKVTINGKSVLPTADNVTYDKYTLNGVNVIDGVSAMKWNGTLIIAADKSYFPASGAAAAPASAAAQEDVYHHLVSQPLETTTADHASDIAVADPAVALTSLFGDVGAMAYAMDPLHHVGALA